MQAASAELDYRDFLSPEVIAEFSEDFKDHDLDGKGSLCEEEFQSLLADKGVAISLKQLREVWKEVVHDNNIGMKFEDFCIVWILLLRLKPRADLIDFHDYLDDRTVKELQQAFDQRDPELTGFIIASDALTILRGFGDGDRTEWVAEVLSQVLPGEDHGGAPAAMCRVPSKRKAEIMARLVSAAGGPEGQREKREIDFKNFCAFFAVVKHKQRRINYREFLSSNMVMKLRDLFNSKVMDNGHANLQALMQLLKGMGGMFNEFQMRHLIKEFDADVSGDIDFEEFCIMIVKLRKERRKRRLTPETCDCLELIHKEHFTIPELQRIGFGLEHFKDIGLPVGRLRLEGSVSALDFRRAGYTPRELRRGGVGPTELRRCGFSLRDLRRAGFSDHTLTQVNRTLHDSRAAGDATVLPQYRIKAALAQPALAGDASAQLAPVQQKLQRTFSVDETCAARPLTSWIRSHTDWRTSKKSLGAGPSPFAVVGVGMLGGGS